MIDITGLKNLIDTLPDLLKYIIPGFVFFSLRASKASYNADEDKYFILKSIALSYIWINLMQSFKVSEILNVILFLVVIFIYFQFELENKFLSKFIKKTKNGNLLNDLIDIKKGSWITIYLDEQKLIYEGYLAYYHYDTKSKENKICLQEVLVHDFEGNLLADYTSEDHIVICISMKNVVRFKFTKSKELSLSN